MIAYSIDRLLADSRFHDCLVFAAAELLATHREIPREVRYLADLQKWQLSQATLALHFEHRLDPARPPISPGNLLRFLVDTPIASRNTVLAFLAEMRHYGLVEPVASVDRRQRIFIARPHTEDLIRRWFRTHLEALDRMDGADRAERLRAAPDLILHAQARMARTLLSIQEWCRPPNAIDLFTRAEGGNSILHDIASRAPWQLPAERVWIGSVTSNGIAALYQISQSHTARVLARARDAGLIGWALAGNRGECWVSPVLVLEYRRWQALKFSAISQAFHEAVDREEAFA
jgi:hypothetical protein